MRSSSSRLRVTQRLRRSWAHWRQTRIPRRLAKAEQRLLLLRVETDSQLLKVKELLLLQENLEHRQQEERQSLEWHQGEPLALLARPEPKPEPMMEDPLSTLLGLPTPRL